MSDSKIIVAGGGLSGLMLARMIKLYRNPDAEIIVVEKEENIGGQYGSVYYDGYGYFDIGMHIYYEASIPEIDKVFTSILPEAEWNILDGNYKDIQGLYYKGRLQEDTPCVDLRNLPEEELKKYIADVFLTIKNNSNGKMPQSSNAYELLSNHFGKLLTDEVYVPILEKLYLTDAKNLDELATLFTPLTRVALFDKEVMLDLMKSDKIRERVAYPDQMSLPPVRTNTYRGFYPKKFGFFRVLEKLKEILEAEGVKFMTSSVIKNIEVQNNAAKAVTVSGKQGDVELPVKEIFWSAGLPPLAHTLGVNISDLTYDKKLTEAMYVYFLFDKKPLMGGLYYFFCFDKGYSSFRVTDYSNYCTTASDGRGYPMCIEFWAQPQDSKEEKDIIAQALNELNTFGVIDASFKTLFSKVEKLKGGGFPLPSVKNIRNMEIIRDRIADTGIKNIIPTGVLTNKNVFFIKDVLADSYKKAIAK
jgi:protoporphyrinogen oxidase